MKLNTFETALIGGSVLVGLVLVVIMLTLPHTPPGKPAAPVSGRAAPCLDMQQIKAMVDGVARSKGIEDKLVELVIKLDEGDCDCSAEERTLILQLKLFHAIKHNDSGDAQEYLDRIFNKRARPATVGEE